VSASAALVSMPLLPAAFFAAFPAETLGWVAAGLTLATFICRDMRRLRLLALAANAAFIAYGALAQLLPVLMLHLLLVPVNLWRLNQAFGGKQPRALPLREAFGPGTPLRRRRPRSWRASSRVAHAIDADLQPAPNDAAPSSAANASAITRSAAAAVRPSARSASNVASPSAVRAAASAADADCTSSACRASFSLS